MPTLTAPRAIGLGLFVLWLVVVIAQRSSPPAAQEGAGAEPAEVASGPPPLPMPETLASRPGASGGEALFLQHCAMCHGDIGMGTGLLARRVEAAKLEDRDDLTLALIEPAVRYGIGNMPPVTRGELSDPDLQAIADYLSGDGEL